MNEGYSCLNDLYLVDIYFDISRIVGRVDGTEYMLLAEVEGNHAESLFTIKDLWSSGIFFRSLSEAENYRKLKQIK